MSLRIISSWFDIFVSPLLQSGAQETVFPGCNEAKAAGIYCSLNTTIYTFGDIIHKKPFVFYLSTSKFSYHRLVLSLGADDVHKKKPTAWSEHIQSFSPSLQRRIIAPWVSWEFPVFKSWKQEKFPFLRPAANGWQSEHFFFSHVKVVWSKWQSLTWASLHQVTCSTQSKERISPAKGLFGENVTSRQRRIFSTIKQST